MVRRTDVLEKFISLDLSSQANALLGKIHRDVMARTSAFLLLKDSKASYAIEGERHPLTRVQRWGRAIGQAGLHPITKAELDDHYDMPDKTVDLLIRFLEQGGGHLSARARSKEFEGLTPQEVRSIEEKYAEVFSLN
jgi:hypothetical protein